MAMTPELAAHKERLQFIDDVREAFKANAGKVFNSTQTEVAEEMLNLSILDAIYKRQQRAKK